jgi:hypothetical protein
MDPASHIRPPLVNSLIASVHFCHGAPGVKSLTEVPVTGVSLLSEVSLDAAT